MEAADSPIHSKVIVQFSDPYNLFEDVAPLLQNRLPLGNLHWKSPARPLRSIKTLDVWLDREQGQSADGTNATRRHQIPGLRQTPFVKVLLVRCDDKEKYKESVRKDTKDWVKALGVSTSRKTIGKGQERHDAFEYLILHVVLPGTAAASQAKSSKHISLEATESTDSLNSKSKWTGKSTSTVLDKLRADFASSSKAPFERVAQVRISDVSRPSAALSPLELEEQWQDLIEKLKAAILQSFDIRVAQYEEDIREREGQRTLPGWNFCTFFILKEGLAKGFDNVGLLEDALQVYEELDAGLDAVIQDQAKIDYADTANALLPYANDLKDTIRVVLEGATPPNGSVLEGVGLSLQAWATAETKRFPWKIERRDYQQMILTNQVSALDFRIYIFIRQMQLMLRRASIPASHPKSMQSRQNGPRWDADLLSEVCERSVKFMNLAARNLRQDLFAAWGGQDGLPEDELKIQKVAIDNIVASWKWASLLQTLSECQIVSSFSNLAARLNGDTPEGQLFSPADIVNSHARGTDTSLSTVSSSDSSMRSGRVTSATQDIFFTLRVVQGSKSELIFWAAELFTMMRTIFVQLCRQSKLLPDVLRGSRVGRYVVEDTHIATVGILSPSLKAMVRDEESAFGAYKLLTVCACQCYTTAARSRTSKQLLFDLAALEMHHENYEAALAWLDAVPQFLHTPPKTAAEQSMLKLFTDCLRRTDRHDDLVQGLLLNIGSSSANAQTSIKLQDSWDEVLVATEQSSALILPFDSLFAIDKIDDVVLAQTELDGCAVRVQIRCLIPLVKLDGLEVELTCQNEPTKTPDQIVFYAKHDGHIKDRLIDVTLSTRTIVNGWYDLVALRLTVGKLSFVLDLKSSRSSKDDDEEETTRRLEEQKSIYVFPRNGSPSLSASQAPLVDLSKKKTILVSLICGSNGIATAQLRLKPATAGLRLDLLTAVCLDDIEFQIINTDDTIVFTLGTIAAQKTTTLEIPYSVDEITTISGSLKAELKYVQGDLEYEIYETLSFLAMLPIGVSVQDIFLTDETYSRFTFVPSRLAPLSILDCDLRDLSGTSVVDFGEWATPVDTFQKQPANWIVRMRPEKSQERKQLKLSITYQCMDEVVLESLTSGFERSICDSEYAHVARPLQLHFRTRTQALWTEQEIELATLTSEVQMWSYEELDWPVLLHAFSKSDRLGLSKWLAEWHKVNFIIPLRAETAPRRQLRLLVDSPRTDLVVATELKVAASAICIVGQPITAQLYVNLHPRVETAAEISVEVSNQSDLWLVGGQRRLIFTTSHKTAQGSLIMVPQKTGSLLLPTIDVKCRATPPATRGADTAKPKELAFEVENLSVATTILVRSHVQSTTIAIGEGNDTEAHWLADSRLASGDSVLGP